MSSVPLHHRPRLNAAERETLALWRAIIRTDAEIERVHGVLACMEAKQDRRRAELFAMMNRQSAALGLALNPEPRTLNTLR